MNKLTRILKHRWLDEQDSLRALGPGALTRLEARIRDSERGHRGEIRLCIEAGLPLSYLWRGASTRERAITMFGKLRVWDTEENNGVLVYLLLAEHKIEIVADRGLHHRVDGAEWQSILAAMAQSFRSGAYEAGLAAAVDAVDALLRAHFPLAEGAVNANELPDAAHLG